MGLRLITGPTDFPVTLAEAKLQCRIDDSMGADEDTLLNVYIASATSYVEQYLGRALMTQTWELVLDKLCDAILIPKGPLQSVAFVKYIDINNVLQTLDQTLYTVDNVGDPGWVVRGATASYPQVAQGVNTVIVRFTSGYVTVPDAIRGAILMLIAQWYDNRSSEPSNRPVADPAGGALTLPNTVKQLLSNFRAYN